MSIFSADEISERTEQLESQLAALDAAIEKLKQEISILELLERF